MKDAQVYQKHSLTLFELFEVTASMVITVY